MWLLFDRPLSVLLSSHMMSNQFRRVTLASPSVSQSSSLVSIVRIGLFVLIVCTAIYLIVIDCIERPLSTDHILKIFIFFHCDTR